MSGDHPYRHMPHTAFWSQSVERNFTPSALYTGKTPLLFPGDRIVSAGSCFAANMVPFLERAGFHYIRTEQMDPKADRFGYSRYSAAYGNIYTSRQFYQLLQRAAGTFVPIEDRWIGPDGAIYDPFRPGLTHSAEDEDEFEILTSAHLSRVRDAFSQASVLLFTLGLTESWYSSEDNAVFPACPGTIAGVFDPRRHRFINFSVKEVASDLAAAILEARLLNPDLRVILTVSPVPLVATATDRHIYSATTYSKAVLRVAAEEISSKLPDVSYFPAYEIVMGPDAHQHFESDRRNVNAQGITTVVDALLANCELPNVDDRIHKPSLETISAELSRSECEETMTDQESHTSRKIHG